MTNCRRPGDSIPLGQTNRLAPDARPEPGSLYDIMRRHRGTPLYVLPLSWTDLHAKLLGARFELSVVPERPLPSPHCLSVPSEADEDLLRNLNTLGASAASTTLASAKAALESVLRTLFPTTLSRPECESALDLHFGGRVFRRALYTDSIWNRLNRPWHVGAPLQPPTPSGSSRGPANGKPHIPQCLAYLNRKRVHTGRQNCYPVRPDPRGVDNVPVLSLRRLWSKQLTPAEADHDVYYIGVLLAMAQSCFYQEQSSRSSSQMSPPEFADVKVQLITHTEEGPAFVVYTAIVTSAFLERFARPTKAPRGGRTSHDGKYEGGLRVSYAYVNFWPIIDLKDRLAEVLGCNIGDGAENGKGSAGEGPNRGVKRKRT